jgi:hypothetical protein
MKKIAIVLFVAASALAGCGKKKAPEAPTEPATTEPAPMEGEGETTEGEPEASEGM